MHLRFNSDRLIARLAAEAAGDPCREAPSDRDGACPWRPPLAPQRPDRPAPLGASPAGRGELGADDPRRGQLEGAIRTAVIGDLSSLDAMLTLDAECWSPSLTFSSLDGVEVALADGTSSLEVNDFGIDALWWCEPVAIAEWHADAWVPDPVLVCDDLLVESAGREVWVAGATLVALRGDRIAAMHTYFDEAAVIEQVLFG